MYKVKLNKPWLKRMFGVLGYFWVLWYYFSAAMLFVFIILPMWIPSLVMLGRVRRRYLHFLRRLWAILQGLLTGIKVVVTEHPDFADLYYHCGRAVIFCPTHRSYLDIHALLEALDGRFAFVAKQELSRNPGINSVMSGVDVLIRRETFRGARIFTMDVHNRLKEGWSMVIFPEGTIVLSDKLGRFRGGAFRTAVELDVPVVPVRMWDTYGLMPDDGRYGGKPGVIRVYFGKPVYPSEVGYDPERMSEVVRRMLQPY